MRRLRLNVRAGWAVIALVVMVSLAGCGDVNLGTIKKEPILNRAPGWTVNEHREGEGVDKIARINETWQAPVPPKQAKAEIDRRYKHLCWKPPGSLPDIDVTIDWRSIDGKTIIGIGFYPKGSSSSEILVNIDRGRRNARPPIACRHRERCPNCIDSHTPGASSIASNRPSDRDRNDRHTPPEGELPEVACGASVEHRPPCSI